MGGRIAIIVAIVVGLLAAAGVFYLYQKGVLPRFETADKTPAGTVAPEPKTSPPETAALPEPGTAPAPKEEGPAGVTSPAEPTVVPSFDVVVIDPSGEGVIAGRAAPGWEVSVESGGAKVAGATADAQGEWSAVLEKPLAAGDHALSLKITSPDGTRALSSQERVRVEVGGTTKVAAAPPQTAPSSDAFPGEAPAAPPTAGQSVTPQKQAPDLALTEPKAARVPDLAADEPRATARPVSPDAQETKSVPPQSKLAFKTVDYNDKGASSGSVSITGTSDPGATIKVYSDDELLATVRADPDGSWSVVAEKTLPTGEHKFRAEHIDTATGAPSARAMVAIERLVPKPPQIAAKETKGTVPTAKEAASETALRTKDVYTVKRGDTLWAIAKRYFGSGLRYPTIFQDNREILTDPDLIHPQQEVKVPPE